MQETLESLLQRRNEIIESLNNESINEELTKECVGSVGVSTSNAKWILETLNDETTNRRNNESTKRRIDETTNRRNDESIEYESQLQPRDDMIETLNDESINQELTKDIIEIPNDNSTEYTGRVGTFTSKAQWNSWLAERRID